jgi:hypothetical protein
MENCLDVHAQGLGAFEKKTKKLYNTVKQIVINQFKQIWYSNLQSSPKALNYHMFREQLEQINKQKHRKLKR